MKICTKCQRPKDAYFKVAGSDKLRSACKDCMTQAQRSRRSKNATKARAYRKRHYETNKLRSAETDKEWYAKNRVRKLKKCKNYQQKNLVKRAAHRKTRLHEDVQYRLANNLRSRLHRSLVADFKSGSAVQDLGCTISELRLHLEAQFQPGMSWANWGRNGWHIDHIRALAKFDLTNREQFLQAVHYTNLQPLWAEKNLKKGSS
jgi:hypothetical protein